MIIDETHRNIMVNKKLENPAFAKPDFLCVVGSHLYGTNIENSDTDVRGFTFLTPEYMLGIKNFDLIEHSKEHDLVIWSVKKFINMLLNGSTIAFEMLSCSQESIIECSDLAKRL
mgnify:CR=1 FL=1